MSQMCGAAEVLGFRSSWLTSPVPSGLAANWILLCVGCIVCRLMSNTHANIWKGLLSMYIAKWCSEDPGVTPDEIQPCCTDHILYAWTQQDAAAQIL